jgi:uncharacterized protein DUF5676
MRLDARAFGLAAGAAAAVLCVICAAAVAIAPEATTAIAGELIHADLSGMTGTLTLGSFISGLICWFFGITVTFWFVAWIYNWLAGRRADVRVNGL